ncbi:MAG TPA: type II toxin-antitoxin system death-on-curing family toxin [Thermoguttaceae bacterium]|nr:type II toxin-antitoxin system death-on-curing family toxin [Thermoguttaceae bacterium]
MTHAPTFLELGEAVPRATFGGRYLHADLFEMAAAYLFHVCQNHPFIDGNKRTGAVAALIFLMLNSVEIDADENAFEQLVRSVAEGKADKAAVADFFREHAEP